MRAILTALTAALLMVSGHSAQAQSSNYKQFERDWIKDIKGPSTFTAANASSGFTLNAVVPAESKSPKQIQFRCAPLRESAGFICAITNVPSQSHRGIHLTGSPEKLVFGNPWDPGKWIDLNVRRREGKTMP